MTARRQENKGRYPNRPVTVLAVAIGMAGPAVSAWAAVTERVVVNRYSGLAIDGLDPVAYFTDAEPAREAGIEASAGVVWRFRNEANRAVFWHIGYLRTPVRRVRSGRCIKWQSHRRTRAVVADFRRTPVSFQP